MVGRTQLSSYRRHSEITLRLFYIFVLFLKEQNLFSKRQKKKNVGTTKACSTFIILYRPSVFLTNLKFLEEREMFFFFCYERLEGPVSIVFQA